MKGGRIRPTDGIAFKVLARFLLETRDEVLDALIAIERGEVSSVRFGCTPLVDQGLFRTFCDLHKEILPICPVLPTHGDTPHLAEEVVSGTVDAAFVTLPLRHPDLRIEEVRRDRLVVCLRRDDPLAAKASLLPSDWLSPSSDGTCFTQRVYCGRHLSRSHSRALLTPRERWTSQELKRSWGRSRRSLSTRVLSSVSEG